MIGGSVLAAIVGLLAIVVLTGVAVARVTRARPGSEALSFGIVAALFMAIAFFALTLGFEGVAGSHDASRAAVALLTDAAFESGDKADAAKQELYQKYPGLESLPSNRRSNTLAYRVYYDGIYQIPRGMLFGMLASAVLCSTPCLAGTTFGSKLLSEKPRRWALAPVYLEFMAWVAVLVACLFVATLVWLTNVSFEIANAAAMARVAFLLSLLGATLVLLYRRRLSWWGRLLLYGLMVVGVLV